MNVPATGRPVAWWLFPTLPVVAAAIAFAWTLNAELLRLYGMTSPAGDLAYDQQVVWNISHASFAGINLELMLVVLAGIEKVWPSPAVLLIFSTAGLAATAPAAYLFFRALLPAGRAESPWVAVALSAPIPFWAALDLFDAENIALPLALLAAWAGLSARRVAMWILCVLVLMCGADQAYTVGIIGILMGAYGPPEVRQHWRPILYVAGAWFLVAIAILHRDVPTAVVLLFTLIVAAGIGARKLMELRSIRPAFALFAILPALLLASGAGGLPPALGAEPGAYSHPSAVAQLRRATLTIPADAPVNADPGLTVWLANRRTINDFPDKLDATCYVVLDRDAYVSGPARPIVRLAAIAALPDSGRSVLYDDGRFQVWGPVGGD
jgi:hypothetical protein